MANLDKQFVIFIGKKIREEREKMGISQEQLGKIAKMHRTYVGMIERGEKNITIYNLRKFAVALRLQVRDLVDFD
ncbi:MAG: helix-turn-helix transcriptional regulator [Candidatus Taylorbacteria bacterium]